MRRPRLTAPRVAAVVLVVVGLVSFAGAPLASHVLRHGPDQLNFKAGGRPLAASPVGAWTWVPGDPAYMPHRSLYVLGADGQTGRDLFLRLLYGGRTSLEIALIASLVSVGIGVPLGLIAGYRAGRVGGVIVWICDLVMACPLLLFGIAVYTTVGYRLELYDLHELLPRGALLIALIIGAFTWYYPLRLTRVLVLSLREREFVEASRMLGAGELHIVRRHLVPHLAIPIATYTAVIAAHAMVAEAGLAFLGLRISPPEPSWGGLLADAPQTLLGKHPGAVNQPDTWVFLVPVLCVLVTVIALNLLADGLRRRA